MAVSLRWGQMRAMPMSRFQGVLPDVQNRSLRAPLTLTLAALLALQLVLSSAWLAHEAHHKCAGEDCPICHVMVQMLKGMSQGALAGGSASCPPIMPALALRQIIRLPHAEVPTTSLVGLGVRLDI